jgi:hypothetical protein
MIRMLSSQLRQAAGAVGDAIELHADAVQQR